MLDCPLALTPLTSLVPSTGILPVSQLFSPSIRLNSVIVPKTNTRSPQSRCLDNSLVITTSLTDVSHLSIQLPAWGHKVFDHSSSHHTRLYYNGNPTLEPRVHTASKSLPSGFQTNIHHITHHQLFTSNYRFDT